MNLSQQNESVRKLIPASILVIDLVRYSTRPKRETQEILNVLRKEISSAREELALTKSEFIYTGDGYFCNFSEEDSAAVLDFVNYVVPQIILGFATFKQCFRAGIDFGFVEPVSNPLSHNQEFFELAGIQAARLQEAAKENQILCTEEFKKLFEPHFSGMFSAEPFWATTKDRAIRAHVLTPQSLEETKSALQRFLLEEPSDVELQRETKYRILVVDDEEVLLRPTAAMLSSMGFEVRTALNAKMALSLFQRESFEVVLTDIVMPEMSGYELIQRILTINSKVKIIAWSGYVNDASGLESLKYGADFFLSKPVTAFQLKSVINSVLTDRSPQNFKKYFRGLCHSPEEAINYLQKIKEILIDLQESKLVPTNYALRLLRHKGSHIITELLTTIKPRCNLTHNLQVATVQFICLARLSNIVKRTSFDNLQIFLSDYVNEQKQVFPNVEFSLLWHVERIPNNLGNLADAMVLVVCELIDNAVSAIDRKGIVRIEVTYMRASGLLRIAVSDSGPGVDKALVVKMFQQGNSTKGPGRGLGLSLIKNVVSLLKGEVRYEYSKGAVFTILIPHS